MMRHIALATLAGIALVMPGAALARQPTYEALVRCAALYQQNTVMMKRMRAGGPSSAGQAWYAQLHANAVAQAVRKGLPATKVDADIAAQAAMMKDGLNPSEAGEFYACQTSVAKPRR